MTKTKVNFDRQRADALRRIFEDRRKEKARHEREAREAAVALNPANVVIGG